MPVLSTSSTQLMLATDQVGADSAARSCEIRAAAAVHAARPGVLVDVRPQAMYSRVWIPGSANLGKGLLASNLLVKSASSVVLVGNGKETPELLRRCKSLHADGMTQVHVLDGGLPAWHRAGGAVAGDTSALDQPLLLDNAELHAWLSQDGAVIVLADNESTPALAATGALVIRAAAKGETTTTLLGRIPKRLSESKHVIVFLAAHGNPSPWRNAARAQGLPDPLFFMGGPSRYENYLKQVAGVVTAASLSSSACRSH